MRWAVAVTAAMVTGPLGPAAAAQPPAPQERVEVARLLVDARVIDRAGQPILGLVPDDFTVEIDGEPARVDSAQWIGGETTGTAAGAPAPTDRGPTPAASPRLVVVMVQTSMEAIRLRGLLRLLGDSARLLSALTPADRVAVLSFDHRVHLWLDFTDDLDRVETVLARELLFQAAPAAVAPSAGPSLASSLQAPRARRTFRFEEALERLGEALEPLPGAKTVVLVGHGFGDFTVVLGMPGATLGARYERARAALVAARAAVFSLDVTMADSHTFEHGLQVTSEETGGFYRRTYPWARRALDQVADALAGHYVLFVVKPETTPGRHRIDVALRRRDGTVLARRSYDEEGDS